MSFTIGRIWQSASAFAGAGNKFVGTLGSVSMASPARPWMLTILVLKTPAGLRERHLR